MYPLLETIKIYNGTIANLHYHQKRMDTSYMEFFDRKNPFLLKDIIRIPRKKTFGIIKCRVLYNVDSFSVSFEAYKPKQSNTLRLVYANHIDYHLKFTDRSDLNKLLEQKNCCDDILIVKNGLITDTSYSNIAFFNGKKWFTPQLPLLKGTKRQSLIEKTIIYPFSIKVDDLTTFEGFRLINSMLSFDGQSIKPVKNIHGIN